MVAGRRVECRADPLFTALRTYNSTADRPIYTRPSARYLYMRFFFFLNFSHFSTSTTVRTYVLQQHNALLSSCRFDLATTITTYRRRFSVVAVVVARRPFFRCRDTAVFARFRHRDNTIVIPPTLPLLLLLLRFLVFVCVHTTNTESQIVRFTGTYHAHTPFVWVEKKCT